MKKKYISPSINVYSMSTELMSLIENSKTVNVTSGGSSEEIEFDNSASNDSWGVVNGNSGFEIE